MPRKKEYSWTPKKIVYVFLTVALGKLLGLLIFGLLNLKFIAVLEKRSLPVEYNQIFWFIWSPLPSYLYWSLIWTGAIGGFFLGLRWWQMVYVEKRHWKKWKNGCC